MLLIDWSMLIKCKPADLHYLSGLFDHIRQAHTHARTHTHRGKCKHAHTHTHNLLLCIANHSLAELKRCRRARVCVYLCVCVCVCMCVCVCVCVCVCEHVFRMWFHDRLKDTHTHTNGKLNQWASRWQMAHFNTQLAFR